MTLNPLFFSFLAQNETEMMSWIEALTKAVGAALTDLKSSGSTAKELIQRIYEEPSNAFCADCNSPGIISPILDQCQLS